MNLHSGYPYWLVKEGIPYNYPKLEQNIKADVVIMGGGISGALLAYHLLEAGVECIVVDARTIGLGSTSASTGLLQYEIDTPLSKLVNLVGEYNAVRSYQLCAESIIKIGNIAKKIGFKDFSFQQSLYYAAYKKDVAFLKEEFDIRKKNGFKVTFFDAEDVNTNYHFDAPAAILSQEGGQINAYAFTNALLQYLSKKGLKIFDRTNIKNIQHHKAGVKLKTERGYTIKAKQLMYATGYEVVNYIDKKIVDLHSTFACISEQANEAYKFWTDNVLCWNTADPYLYLRTNDRRIIIGGRDEEFYNPTRRDELLPQKTKQLIADFNKLFPDIDFKYEFAWTGTFGATKDGLPFIGKYKTLANSFFALGFGGNGITFSLIAAEIIRDMITGKQNKDADIFSFNR